MMSWPSAPMLNMPARNGRATAMPAMISGVTTTRVFASCSTDGSPPKQKRPNPPQASAWYALKGSPPVTATMTAPTAKASSTDPMGMASARPAPRRLLTICGGSCRALRLAAAAIWPLHSNGSFGEFLGNRVRHGDGAGFDLRRHVGQRGHHVRRQAPVVGLVTNPIVGQPKERD